MDNIVWIIKQHYDNNEEYSDDYMSQEDVVGVVKTKEEAEEKVKELYDRILQNDSYFTYVNYDYSKGNPIRGIYLVYDFSKNCGENVAYAGNYVYTIECFELGKIKNLVEL